MYRRESVAELVVHHRVKPISRALEVLELGEEHDALLVESGIAHRDGGVGRGDLIFAFGERHDAVEGVIADLLAQLLVLALGLGRLLLGNRLVLLGAADTAPAGAGRAPLAILVPMVTGGAEMAAVAARVRDRATYEGPPRHSEGIRHVLVAGTFVVRDGESVDGAFPGRPVLAGG